MTLGGKPQHKTLIQAKRYLSGATVAKRTKVAQLSIDFTILGNKLVLTMNKFNP